MRLTPYLPGKSYPRSLFRYVDDGTPHEPPDHVIEVNEDDQIWRVFNDPQDSKSARSGRWTKDDTMETACVKADLAAIQLGHEIPSASEGMHGRFAPVVPAVQDPNYRYETELPNDQIIAHRPSLCALCVAGDHSCRDRFCDCDCCMRLHG